MENFGVPTPWTQAEGHTHRVASARREGTPRGLRPRARPETPRTGTGRSHDRQRREGPQAAPGSSRTYRSEEHTSELQSLAYLVCRLLLEKKKKDIHRISGAN